MAGGHRPRPLIDQAIAGPGPSTGDEQPDPDARRAYRQQHGGAGTGPWCRRKLVSTGLRQAPPLGGRIRCLESVTSLFPHDLLIHLQRLASDLDADPDLLVDDTAGLAVVVDEAVSGYAGLQLTVVHTGVPVTLSLVVPDLLDEVVTSIGIPLPLLSTVHEPGGRAVLHSTVPGAFVDLAADLAYVLEHDGHLEERVALDVDLPPSTTSLLTGVADLTTLSRAAGFLIGQGHDPDTAQDTLRTLAAAAGLTTVAFAAHLLHS